MNHASILATIAAAPVELRPHLRRLVSDVAGALDRFGRACEAGGVAPPASLAHCTHAVMMACALVERDARADYSSLPPFRPDAFAQRAMAAALVLIADETATQPLRRVQ